jgi:transcriptional regulator with XRE-family HTH domain
MCAEIPVVDLAATGANIIKLRKKSGLTVRDLQQVLGFANPQAIYKWQSGSCLPTVDNLLILSAVFGVPIEEILVCWNCPVH